MEEVAGLILYQPNLINNVDGPFWWATLNDLHTLPPIVDPTGLTKLTNEKRKRLFPTGVKGQPKLENNFIFARVEKGMTGLLRVFS